MKRGLFLIVLVGAWAFGSATNVCAQSGAGLMVVPWEEGEQLETSDDIYFFRAAQTRDGTDTGVTLTRFVDKFRYKFNPDDPNSPVFGGELIHMDVGTDFAGLPQRLVDHSIAYGFHLGTNEDGWHTTAQVGIGFAGDRPFSDSDAWYGYGNMMWTKQIDKDTVHRFIVEYDGNRTFTPDIPIPGFVMFKHVDENLDYALGLPYSAVFWKDDSVQAEISYFFPLNGKARISTSLTEDITLYGEAQSWFEAYHINNTPEHQRLFFMQRRVEGGMVYEPDGSFNMTLAAGWAFGQEFSTGWDSRDLATVAKVEGGPYVRIGLSFDH
jgi:hypothetical protein